MIKGNYYNFAVLIKIRFHVVYFHGFTIFILLYYQEKKKLFLYFTLYYIISLQLYHYFTYNFSLNYELQKHIACISRTIICIFNIFKIGIKLRYNIAYLTILNLGLIGERIFFFQNSINK